MNVIAQSPKRTNPNVLLFSSTGADQRLKRPSVESVSESSQKKRPTPAENSSCSSDGEELRGLLKRTGTGRIFLALAQKTSSLKYEKDQNKLTEIIIENKILNSSNFKIKSDEFPEIVKSIQSLFPVEETTYFIPYRNSEGSQKCQAKGKLVSKYYTLRKEMTAAGIISKKRESVDSDDDDHPSPGKRIYPAIMLRLSSIQKLLKSKPKKGPSKRARDGNDNTAREEVGDVDTTVTSYIATYPALRSKEGYTLFETDFAHLYPHHTLRIYSEFDDFSTRALKALNSIEKKPKALENNLEILEDGDLSDEAKHLVVLLSLCYLDNVVTATRTKRDNTVLSWRPPQPEIQEGFITHVETPGRADSFISKRYEKFASWGLPVQPFVVVCGPSVEEIDDCFVVLSKTVKFNGIQSVRRALDICFKIIHAVNAEYSCESYRLWMLIQKRLYKLDTKADNVKNDAQLPNVLKSGTSQISVCDIVGSSVPDQNSAVAGCDTNLSKLEDCDPEKTDSVEQHKTPDPNVFKDQLKDYACKLIAKLNAKPGQPRSMVQEHVNDSTEFLSSTLSTVDEMIKAKLMESNVDPTVTKEISEIFSVLKNPFDGLTSEYFCFKYLKEKGYFIEPKEFDIDSALVTERVDKKVKLEVDVVKGIFIPLRKVLKAFLELPNVFDIVMAALESKQPDGIIGEFIHAPHWQAKKLQFGEKIVIPLNPYHDDYEVDKELGPHSAKLGAVYVRLACLPSEFQGHVENIFLALLFNSDDRKEFGNKLVFRKLVKEFNFLQQSGIEIRRKDCTVRVYFAIGVLSADNAAMHLMLGFTECFTSNYPCRFCKVYKHVMHYQCEEDPTLFRDRVHHDMDIAEGNVTRTGVNGRSVFEDVKFFHSTENPMVD
ncbi:hypothetical protein ONE63_009548 [Megalurothrips usitatus]|uniref:Uncharacterized protein n=1 Tax=Megalurothrips usitatus TaxID=439358 RepID=A0AAV7XP67_9NEOP|nr:hypothetical protein ONE63_009548 [Megalurothrips usitatus]